MQKRAAHVHRDATGNRLLDAFVRENEQVQLGLERVAHPAGYELYGERRPVSYVYFPTSAVFSLVVRTRAGKASGVATVGNEGIVGLPVYLGVSYSPQTVLQQLPGEALRMHASRFALAIRESDGLQQLLRCYSAYSLRSAYQSAACNALHVLAERTARWLLIAHDRAASDRFRLSQAVLAETLGVRRQSVNEVVRRMRDEGVIDYEHAVVTIRDREALERQSCECYTVMDEYYTRLLGRLC